MTLKYRVEWDASGIAAAKKRYDANVFGLIVRGAMGETLQAGRTFVVERTPVDTGKLSSSIFARLSGVAAGVIGTTVEYARPVEEGWSAHEVVAKNAPVLASYKGGKLAIYGKRVMIPAHGGAYMFRDSIPRITETMARVFRNHLGQALS